MKIPPRHATLGAFALATALAAWWPMPNEDGMATPSNVRETRIAAPRQAAASAPLPRLHPLRTPAGTAPTDATAPPGDLFPAQSWAPPTAAAPPSAPSAPPLPFGFGGRYVEAGRTVVFLLLGDSVLPARVGDTVSGGYRLDAIEPAALRLTYLPLNIRQTLHIGTMVP